MTESETLDEVRGLLGEALGLGAQVERLNADSALLGAIPEFDSMAVVTVLTLMEERFDVEISDDEVDAETFETLGTLAQFMESKRAS